MRIKASVLTIMFMFLLGPNVFAMEKLPADVLNAFQSSVNSFQNKMSEEKDKTHHLTNAEIYQMKDVGYRIYRLDQKKVLKEEDIDLYDAVYTNDTWYIPVSDRVRYEVNKVDGVYKLVGYGVYDENNTIPYETFEKTAIEKGLKDFVYIDEPALHINGFIGKTAKGSQFLSFNKNDNFKLQKNEIKDGKELIDEIKIKVNEAKMNGNQRYGGSGNLISKAIKYKYYSF